MTTDYTDSKGLWEKLPFWKRNLFPAWVFDKVPVEHRREAFVLLSAEDPEGRTCDYEKVHANLIAQGVADEWGQLVGDPRFGVSPMDGASLQTISDPGEYDHDHGEKDTPIVEDLALPDPREGRQAWGSEYLFLPDGRHGPSKRSLAQKKSRLAYCRLTGHIEKGSYIS